MRVSISRLRRLERIAAERVILDPRKELHNRRVKDAIERLYQRAYQVLSDEEYKQWVEFREKIAERMAELQLKRPPRGWGDRLDIAKEARQQVQDEMNYREPSL